MDEPPSPDDGATREPEGLTAKLSPSVMHDLLAAAQVSVTPAHRHWQPPSVEELQRMLPQYEITAFIARGGMGAVYKGVQRTLERTVAIKILPPDIATEDGEANYVQRFKQEARAMARFKHPGIVTVYEAGEVSLVARGSDPRLPTGVNDPGYSHGLPTGVNDPGYTHGTTLLYFVMEFIEGTDVAQLVAAQGQLPPQEAIRITTAVCDALAYAHSRGVVHRDIKPSNIMIDADGQVKVADFGLAKITTHEESGLTKSSMTMGTPDFVAPEAMIAGTLVDQRADLYAVGVMLYQMLTGHIPRGRFSPISSVVPKSDPKLDAIVDKAMQTDREKRYSSAVEMKTDVEKVATRSGGLQPPSANTPAVANRRSLTLPALAAAVIVLGVGGWMVWKQGAGNPSAKISAPPAWQKLAMPPSAMLAKAGSEIKSDGELHVGRGTEFPNFKARNLSVRGELRLDPSSTNAYVSVRKEGAGRQFSLNVQSKDVWITAILPSEPKPKSIARVQLPDGVDLAGGWLPFEFAAIGRQSYLRLGSTTFPPASYDGVLEAGDILAGGNVSFRHLEAINLDALSEEESLKRLEAEWKAHSASTSSPGNAPASATKDAPFVNSLGMKFVPVPITGGPTDTQRVLFSIWETRVQDYEAFAQEAKHEWPKPPLEQGPTHPAVSVSWEDATAFCAWLTDKERKAGKIGAADEYRLPSDHEWSCAVGIGDKEDGTQPPHTKQEKLAGVYPWGTDWPPPKGTGNYHDETALKEEAVTPAVTVRKPALEGYDDGWAWTAPVGSFAPNAPGLFDLSGNASEWCNDWMVESRQLRVVRGGEYAISDRKNLLSSYRMTGAPDQRYLTYGFRVVLAISTSTAATGPHWPHMPTEGEKKLAFTNSLGMKFVPVPGTAVLFCIHETRKRDYAAYAAAVPGVDDSWKKPFHANILVSSQDDHPVVNVSWLDAIAFCGWLSKKEDRTYRLPTDREWSFAVGIGEQDSTEPEVKDRSQKVPGEYPWGTQWPPPQGAGNLADESLRKAFPNDGVIEGYADGFPTCAPVMSFAPNNLGIHDLAGNIWEWCEDWSSRAQKERVGRGGAYDSSDVIHLLSSYRVNNPPEFRHRLWGFRIVAEKTLAKDAR